MTQVDNQITEEWKDVDFSTYNAIPLAQASQLRNQKHVNIRSFYGDSTTVSVASRDIYMLFMDTLSMSELILRSMNELDAEVSVHKGENWSSGSWTRDSARKNWNTLSVSCVANTTAVTFSIIRI